MSKEEGKRILRKSLELFAEKGFESAGTQELCHRAGVSKPTLYHYFKSKQGIGTAIFETYGKPFLRTQDQTLEEPQDPRKSLENYALAFAEKCNKEKFFFQFWIGLYYSPIGSESHELGKSFTETLNTQVYEFFCATALAHGNLRSKEILLSRIWVGQLIALSWQILTTKMSPPDHEVRLFTKQFLYGIFS